MPEGQGRPGYIFYLKVDGEDQPAAAQISPIETPLDQAQEEAIPLVEWALTPIDTESPLRCKPRL